MQLLQDRLALALSAMEPPGSQAALAKACGLSGPSVSNWFSGKTKSLKHSSLMKAAAYLQVSPEWLSSGAGEMRPNGATHGGLAGASPSDAGGPRERTNREMLMDLRRVLSKIPEDKRHGMAGLWATFCNTAGDDAYLEALLILLDQLGPKKAVDPPIQTARG